MRRTTWIWSWVILGIAGESSAQTTWTERTLGGMRTLVYVPSAESPRGGRGLLVVLHGCTQQPEAYRDRGGLTEPAEAFGVVIAAPAVPNGGVYAGCWDYYGANHTRSTRHDGPVLRMVDALLGDASLGIDPAQVYVAGLSSGGGEAAVLGCLAPDVFAGVGINAGPAVGTEASQIATVAANATMARATCRQLAGAQADQFATQLASIAYGSMDYIVARGYGPVHAESLAALYANPALEGAPLAVDTLRGYQPRGTGEVWADAEGPRITRLEITGMGHAWPAGTGAGSELSFIASQGPSWPWHLLELFTTQNRRAGGGPLPVDAGFDDQGQPVDAGPRPDAAGPGPDAQVRDSGGASDAGIVPDSGPGGPIADGEMDGGCGCRAGRGAHPGAGWGLALLAFVWWRLRLQASLAWTKVQLRPTSRRADNG